MQKKIMVKIRSWKAVKGHEKSHGIPKGPLSLVSCFEDGILSNKNCVLVFQGSPGRDGQRGRPGSAGEKVCALPDYL